VGNKKRKQKTAARRRAAIAEAVRTSSPRQPSAADQPPAETVVATPGPVAAEQHPAPVAAPADGRDRRRAPAGWLIGGSLAALMAIVAILAIGMQRTDDEIAAATTAPSIVVGTPGGAVIAAETATPSAVASPTPAAMPTAVPTPAPTPLPTAVPTPAPVAVVTPAPAPANPPPPATPEPTAVIVALAQPDDSVAAFYGNVAAGNFDAAYSLWSDRMKATYPRQENLDDRFDDTASITFEQLFVASRTSRTATVQANFVETYDSGSSREFIGYWELVLVDGRWLLDAPHY
jgi:hypothetical protein